MSRPTISILAIAALVSLAGCNSTAPRSTATNSTRAAPTAQPAGGYANHRTLAVTDAVGAVAFAEPAPGQPRLVQTPIVISDE